MSIKIFLRAGVFLILLFSANAHAFPIFQLDLAPSLDGDAYDAQYGDLTRISTGVDDVRIPANPLLWNQHTAANAAPSANYPGGIDILYGFHSVFGSDLPGLDMASFLILDHPLADLIDVTHIVGSSEDKNAADEFFAMLGISLEDPLTVEKNSQAFIRKTSPAVAPAIVRQSSRDGCLQPQQEQSHKRGGSLCPEEIGSGGSSGSGRSGRGRDLMPGGSGSAGLYPHKSIVDSGDFGGGGAGLGGSGGGGGTGQSHAGGTGAGTGSDSTNPGTGIGGNGDADSWFDFDNSDGGGVGGGFGISGTGGNGNQGEGGIIPNEISAVPEPSTLALFALGLIGLLIARKSGRKHQDRYQKSSRKLELSVDTNVYWPMLAR
ncbi:PEP-CTERM protein-sorting domain-containing protein [Nitrosospira sp. Nsp18]|uniref:PEP-CTERM sorting domain-containing protein n=1 Tax=Nitrosospira sp. Nsp18 TaxID=1855334 RepID=UPI00088B04A5|nr:PEP-CTERM sorting domain-containing protein [Nitrosospira sp. Nsp18]SDA11424.1 PEP-CTERM protein-sorting domain-containing protein [Nitrosospira sp. Nsp18]